MTHFKDLTPYTYGAATSAGAGVCNIGWLAPDVEFETAPAGSEFVERLWQFCKVSINQTRGLHECEFCRSREANLASWKREKLLLGSAEVRIISSTGETYAAPNLIHHYVTAHSYSPPRIFVEAVLFGPCPPDATYFEELSARGYDGSSTLVPEAKQGRFRFVKTPDGIIRIEE